MIRFGVWFVLWLLWFALLQGTGWPLGVVAIVAGLAALVCSIGDLIVIAIISALE